MDVYEEGEAGAEESSWQGEATTGSEANSRVEDADAPSENSNEIAEVEIHTPVDYALERAELDANKDDLESEDDLESGDELIGVAADQPSSSAGEQESAEASEFTEEPTQPKYRIVIDPGHQKNANLSQEPIGPGASETKYKVSGGTSGRFTGLAEYELNLQVSLKLRDALEAQGYEVILTRETNDVDLSNAERSQIANEADADAFIRIHANGSEDATTNGLLTVCMTEQTPYHAELYAESRRLSQEIVDGVAEATGAKNCGVWETDTMSGINWSEVPVTILEMGYMTNPTEDYQLSDPAYQEQIVDGILAGLNCYFSTKESETEEFNTQAEDANQSTLSALETQIQTELDRLSSRWDVWVETLSNGENIHCTRNIDDGEALVSASLIKLFIMGTVYERIEAGMLAEDDVWNSLYSMITISDNDSANRLTRILGDGDTDAGRQAVNDWAASIGCGDVQFNRLMLENNGLENYVSASSCAKLLRMIYRGECISGDCSQQMLTLLKSQQVNDRIPGGLPGGTSCAHKTGNLSGLCVGDVGIIYSPGGDYILCAICNDPITDAGATQEIVLLSQWVYSYINEE